MLKLAGVSEAAQTDGGPFRRARAPRGCWSICTAVVASTVISAFQGSIDQLVALAILMPIVASLGGNAATQALTVAVRAIASRDLTQSSASRYILREALTAVANGAIFALVLAIVVQFWFSNPLLRCHCSRVITSWALHPWPLTLRRPARPCGFVLGVRHLRHRHRGLSRLRPAVILLS